MKFEKITYAGHSSVFFSSRDLEVAIDPWVSGPTCPDSLKNPKKLDLIVLTHGHADHAGDAANLAKSTGATIAATWELALHMGKEGVAQDKLIPMNKGGTVQFKGLDVTLTHAFHSSSYDTATGTIYTGEPCGIVFRDGTTSIYHAGDTALFSDMKLIGEFYKPTVAILPIGDRFTMGPREAAKAVSYIGCKTVIPVHYGTFDMLTGTVENFREACKGLEVKIEAIKPGESWIIK